MIYQLAICDDRRPYIGLDYTIRVKQVFPVCSEMSDNEQRCPIKFCFRLGHKATETFAKLQQANEDSVFRWFKAFSEGRESIEDEPCSRRPAVSKTLKMSLESVILCVQIIA
ncbi:HTH_48 domain-containing protein [Trichonephila clavipes]|nr:HTH_48 domain-containing protein [Trichonephila clavipes]